MTEEFFDEEKIIDFSDLLKIGAHRDCKDYVTFLENFGKEKVSIKEVLKMFPDQRHFLEKIKSTREVHGLFLNNWNSVTEITDSDKQKILVLLKRLEKILLVDSTFEHERHFEICAAPYKAAYFSNRPNNQQIHITGNYTTCWGSYCIGIGSSIPDFKTFVDLFEKNNLTKFEDVKWKPAYKS